MSAGVFAPILRRVTTPCGAFGGQMSLVKDLLVAASVAAGNVASRERDRAPSATDDDGRPRPISERVAGRTQALWTEGTAKLAVSQTAHLGAREAAKRVNQEVLKKVFGTLAKSPATSAGAALFLFDAARDGVRLARGHIGGGEFAERMGATPSAWPAPREARTLAPLWGRSRCPSWGPRWVGSLAASLAASAATPTAGERFARSSAKATSGTMTTTTSMMTTTNSRSI